MVAAVEVVPELELVLAPVLPFHRLAPHQIQRWQWAPQR